MQTDKEKLLIWTANIYTVKEPKVEGEKAKQFKMLAVQKLVEFIKWVERESNKLET